jgi:hypothetical protein
MTITSLSPDQTDEAVRVLARAFVTNPLHVVVFGRDAVSSNEAFFRIGLSAMTGEKRVVVDDGRGLAVMHWVDSPNCQFSWWQMQQFCSRLDESAAVGYLETDRPENVIFYRKFGFVETHTIPIYGVANYFMRRG